MLWFTIFVDKKEGIVFLEENCEFKYIEDGEIKKERITLYADEYPLHQKRRAERRRDYLNQFQKRIIAKRGKR